MGGLLLYRMSPRFDASETLQHRTSGYQIKSTDAVDGEHFGVGIQIRQVLDDMGDAFNSSSSRECALEWGRRPFDGWIQLLRHRACHQTPECVRHHDAPNSSR